jgi:hypothetical protein
MQAALRKSDGCLCQTRANKVWHLYKDLLCKASSFFDRAFRGSFREAVSRTLDLLNDNADSFDIFIAWLYKGNKFLLRSPDGNDTIFKYLKLYVLGSRLLILNLENVVIDVIYSYLWTESNRCPSLQHVRYLYDNTECGYKMRILLVERVAAGLLSEMLEGSFPEEWQDTLSSSARLGCDIVRTIYEWRVSTLSFLLSSRLRRSPCQFHNHNDETSCGSV